VDLGDRHVKWQVACSRRAGSASCWAGIAPLRQVQRPDAPVSLQRVTGSCTGQTPSRRHWSQHFALRWLQHGVLEGINAACSWITANEGAHVLPSAGDVPEEPAVRAICIPVAVTWANEVCSAAEAAGARVCGAVARQVHQVSWQSRLHSEHGLDDTQPAQTPRAKPGSHHA
jgi:hypothetical protein